VVEPTHSALSTGRWASLNGGISTSSGKLL
jgi:hypothetical protein